MRRRRNKVTSCFGRPYTFILSFYWAPNRKATLLALLIHEIYVHGYTFSGHATLLPIIAHASNLFLVF